MFVSPWQRCLVHSDSRKRGITPILPVIYLFTASSSSISKSTRIYYQPANFEIPKPTILLIFLFSKTQKGFKFHCHRRKNLGFGIFWIFDRAQCKSFAVQVILLWASSWIRNRKNMQAVCIFSANIVYELEESLYIFFSCELLAIRITPVGRIFVCYSSVYSVFLNLIHRRTLTDTRNNSDIYWPLSVGGRGGYNKHLSAVRAELRQVRIIEINMEMVAALHLSIPDAPGRLVCDGRVTCSAR